jgi:putative ABC transport system permease protein
MKDLVTANLTHHPGRTAASAAGVAVGVILVVLTVGLTRGMLRDRGQRDTNTGVEILVSHREQWGLSLTSLPLSAPVEFANRLRETPGVAAVAAVGQYLELKGQSGLGLRQIDGVEFESYSQITNIRIVEGQPLPSSGDFLVVDVKYAAALHAKPGDRVTIFDREFTITGIYAPETGARMMIPLATMQEMLGAPGKCSMFLVKCSDATRQEEVARNIVARFPDHRVIFTRDLPRLFAEGYSGLNVFLNAVVALAATISLLVISLTMYTSVAGRAREIGILKSLGASKSFIAGVFIKESLAISLIGVLTGLSLTMLIRASLAHGFGLKVEIEAGYALCASLTGLASGLIGAIYPAMRAANQDVVEALNQE